MAVASALWIVALLCILTEPLAWLWTVLLWLAALGVLGWFWASGVRAAGLSAVVLALGACVASSVALTVPERLAAREHAGRAVELVVDATSMFRAGRDGRLWFTAQTVAVGPPDALVGMDATVRVGIEVPDSGIPSAWATGVRLRVTGLAKEGGPGERAALVVFGRGSVEMIRAPAVVLAIASEVREQFVARAVRLPEPGAGLLPGLAVGDTRAVGEELNQAMLVSGLSHLTAVSGANCAIVVGVVYGVVALCRGGRRLRIALAATALVAFVILVTPEPSVIRAATMAGLAMFALLLGRPGAGVGMLSLAVCVILVGDPWLAATPGFALSAAATGALLLLARPISRGLARWMPEPLALGVAVPLSAQLVCGPILALFAEQQTVVGVAANLLAAPAAPIATVIGLLACLALPIPPLADLFAASAWLPSAWIAATALVSSSVPGSHVRITPGLGPAVVVAVLALAATVLLVRGRRGTPPPLALRRASALLLAVALGVGGGRLLLAGPLAPLTTPEAWSLAACDVGQGDAVVLRSADQIALVDAGPDPAALSACLATLGVDRVDLLVITHFDLDHYGGSSALLGRVGTVLHGPSGVGEGPRVLRDFAASGARTVEGFAGMRGMLGDASWQLLWPIRDSPIFEPGNDTSLVLQIAGGELPRTLLLGDLSASAQRLLLSGGRMHGPYAVVKVAHHGSRDQEPALYAAARAAVTLFTVGENSYGHPHPFALALAGDTQTLRTDLHGLVLLGWSEQGLSVWTER